MKYIKLFNDHSAYAAYAALLDHTNTPNVSKCILENKVYFTSLITLHDYSQDYFTVEAIDDNCTFTFICPSGGIQYSTDGGSTWSEEYGETEVSVSAGDKVLLKGNMILGGNTGYNSYGSKFVTSTGRYNVEGNIFSLYYGDNFTSITDISDYDSDDIMYGGCFYGFFKNDTYLTSAEHLSLPATTLATYCYHYMFRNCTSLIAAPELPATTLVEGCYEGMFQGCESLTTAPELLATTLTDSCYAYMFESCTSLNYVKCLATDISATNCTWDWLSIVASTGTFVKDANMRDWIIGIEGIPESWTIQKVGVLVHDYSQDYFTVEAIDDNCTFTFICPSGGIQYSTDGGSTWSEEYGETEVSVSAGDKVLLKGNMMLGGEYGYNSYGSKFVTSNGRYNVEGNIFSLYYGDNFTDITDISDYDTDDEMYGGCFYGFFGNDAYLVSAEYLSLPATTLASYCYKYMFQYCESLVIAPELPATTLTKGCYEGMFQNCTSLTTVPQLPATTLSTQCYYGMFYGCSALTTAPELPATILATRCYENMFSGCSSLTTTPELPTTTLIQYCYSNMFWGCTNLTAASELPATTLVEGCYDSMFGNCTSLTTAPELPATTLAESCYSNMFYDCSALTTAPELPATTLSSYCYTYMFSGCSSLTTAPELPATILADHCYQYMFSGCSSLNYVKCLATDISASSCTGSWLYNVASTGTFVKDANMTNWSTGTSGIPSDWTIQDAA